MKSAQIHSPTDLTEALKQSSLGLGVTTQSAASPGTKRSYSGTNTPDDDRSPSRRDHGRPDLCSVCSSLNLEQHLQDISPTVALTEEAWGSFDVKIADVGQHYRNASLGSCPLCPLLRACRIIVQLEHNSPETDVDFLHVFRLTDNLVCIDAFAKTGKGKYKLATEALYLSIVPSVLGHGSSWERKDHGERCGFLTFRRKGAPQPAIFAPSLVSPHIDLATARGWLGYCEQNHVILCSSKPKPVAGLRLIHCRSLEVVSAIEDAQYVALSYVWGPSNGETGHSASSDYTTPGNHLQPSNLPSTIVDAIQVTLEMGFEYLWVDRYCIDQTSNAKFEQINQMDSIYRRAELTIIAAAGDGPSYGLPGISRTRKRQPHYEMGNIELLATARHPHVAIQESTWFKRAWTFQEAVLSRRRLVFTDDQAYFECSAMNCHESLQSDLDKLHVKDKSKFREMLQAGLFGREEGQKYGRFDGTAVKRPAHNFIRYQGMVQQYTDKQLTYETDSFNAFVGIARNAEQFRPAIRQIWGVPVRRSPSDKVTTHAFVDGLAWNHLSTPSTDTLIPRRRTVFKCPSWSWCGWEGAAKYTNRSSFNSSEPLESFLHSAAVETSDGSVLSIAKYLDSTENEPQYGAGPTVVRLQGVALPPSALEDDGLGSLLVFGRPAQLAMSTGSRGIPEFLESLQDQSKRRCLCLGGNTHLVFIMILESKGDAWTRIGSLVLWDMTGDGFIAKVESHHRETNKNGTLRPASILFRVV